MYKKERTFYEEVYLTGRLLVLSIAALFLYFWIEDAEIIENFMEKVDRIYIHRGFAVFIFIHLVKYFMGVFGSMALLFFIFRLHKHINKQECI